jgi:hypothetical protein
VSILDISFVSRCRFVLVLRVLVLSNRCCYFICCIFSFQQKKKEQKRGNCCFSTLLKRSVDKCIYSCMHKINTGVVPPIYPFLFRSLCTLQVRHLHPQLVCRHFVQNTKRRGFTASMTITPCPICSISIILMFEFWGKTGNI